MKGPKKAHILRDRIPNFVSSSFLPREPTTYLQRTGAPTICDGRMLIERVGRKTRGLIVRRLRPMGLLV